MYILIVEDVPEIAENLAEVLKGQGHEAVTAYRIADAHDRIEARFPDLIFLDLYLPDGSGLDILNTVSNVPIIVITGTPDEATVDIAFDNGAVAYLVKPFSLTDVLDAIAQIGK
jgi:DNA-binding response OmpR family regulator